MFYRNLEARLTSWANQSNPKPLIIRGARQVGKTTLVQKISSGFDHFISLNLEKTEDRRFFENSDNVKRIYEILLIQQNKVVLEGEKVLLFIDEIQQYPKAIALLRYFFEELPNIHVIAAGSLLEFALGDVPSMPVGRVEQVVLHPMSFDEFLRAMGKQLLYEKWNLLAFEPDLHSLFMDAWMTYLVVGGMPAAVKQYVEEGNSMTRLSTVFDNLWLGYKEDVAKYQRSNGNQKVLQFIMENVPYELDRFSFANFGQTLYKSREISEAFSQLEKARILSLVYPTTSLTLPLTPNHQKRPRIQFLDTGMLLYLNKQQTGILLSNSLGDQFRGGILNHAVWQEVISMSDSPLAKCMFWVREEAATNAEVDLVLPFAGGVLPVEVKSGASGRLRSLFEFIDRTDAKLAVRVLDNHLSSERIQTIKGKTFTLLNVPIYATGKVLELAERESAKL